MISIDVDERTAERLLGRKLTALDRFLGLATDRAIELVEGNMRGRLKLLRSPQNIQDAPARTQPRQYPVKSRREGVDGIVELRPHLTSARSPAIQQLYAQMGIGQELLRQGLWMNPKRVLVNRKTGVVFSIRNNNGYSSREGLEFTKFTDDPELFAWAKRADKGTQLLRHTVRLKNSDILTKLLAAPTVKFCRGRIEKMFVDAARQAMEAE